MTPRAADSEGDPPLSRTSDDGSESPTPLSSLGVVIIGRNEGERLRRCLGSLRDATRKVYVDSGSTDGSRELANAEGAEVVLLSSDRPFTAARARNLGFERLRAAYPTLDCVQFVDGDCEVAPQWLDRAAAFLSRHADVAVVCGRRRERFPDLSVYNRLCDDEWDTPVGEAHACGGDALMRAEAFVQARGFRDELIAGEEPELCLRLRQLGWKVWRLDAEMTLHDAALRRFGQWWRRTERAGHAYAEGAHLHGAGQARHWVREARRAWIWAAGVPASIVAASLVLGVQGAWLALIYPIQVARLTLRGRGRIGYRLAKASLLVLGKFAELAGQLRFHGSRWLRRPHTLIEYK